MRTIFLAVTISAAVAVPALAQNGDPDFTGAHVEGIVGWDNFSAGSGESDSKDDLVFGGALGYDFEAGGVVIGAEVEFTGSGVSASTPALNVPSDNFRLEGDRDIYVGARLGYAATANWLIYAKAGYTNLRVETTYEAGVSGAVITENAADTGGLRVGAGLEYKFNGGLYVKGEYRYSHYGDIADYDIDVDRNQIVIGMGYRF
jgi:outer membrane immunogenic protein